MLEEFLKDLIDRKVEQNNNNKNLFVIGEL